METSSDIFLDDIPWQATLHGMSLNLRDEMLAAIQAPKILKERLPKEFTKEATFIIYVMLAFILLAVLGSSITAYEFFFKGNRKKTYSRRNNFNENSGKRIKRIEDGKKSFKSHYITWLEGFKNFLKCFCMVKNGSKILKTDSTEYQIDCIQGLRFVFNAWVILAHTGVFYIHSIKDVEELKPLLEWRASQLILNGFSATDMFFVISGFLNAYHFFQNYNKFNGNISWSFFYCKRFVRLTPVYMIVLGFYTTLFTYMGMGLVWPAYNTNPVCKKYWWWHLLYINNFEESAKECMQWCWYLAVDMQFYIISPLFMIPLRRWPRFGYALVFACIGGSCSASFMLTYQHNLTDGLSRYEFHLVDTRNFLIKIWEHYDMVYKQPYTRICQYLVGLTLGYYLHKKTINKNVVRNCKMTLTCGWVATASFMWIFFFSLHKRKEILLETAVYNGTKFLLTSCSFAWIIYVCFTGQTEFLNTCLSWKALLPLGRLSYCAYLIHPIILFKLLLQTEGVMDFNFILSMSMYLYTFVCTYFISFIASMFYEMPVLSLLDWLGKNCWVKMSRVTFYDSKTNTQNLSDVYKIS